jgi:hypothetical protein
MKRYNKFLVFWIINSAVFFLSEIFFPQSFVVASNIFAKYQAIVFNGFVWTAMLWLVKPVFKHLEISVEDSKSLNVKYYLVSFATVWFIARFSFITGIGIASFWYVALIAAVGRVFHYLAWKFMGKRK